MKTFHDKPLSFVPLFGAVDTQGCGWVELKPFRMDVFAASQAESEYSLFEALEARLDSLQLNHSSLLRLLCDGLSLHGIHTGDTSDGSLIELDRLGSFLSGLFHGKEVCLQSEQGLLEMLIVEVV